VVPLDVAFQGSPSRPPKSPSTAPGTGTEAPCGLVPQRPPRWGADGGQPPRCPKQKKPASTAGRGRALSSRLKWRSAERVAGPINPKVDGQLVVVRNAQLHDTMAWARVQGPPTKTSRREQGDSTETTELGAEQCGKTICLGSDRSSLALYGPLPHRGARIGARSHRASSRARPAS